MYLRVLRVSHPADFSQQLLLLPPSPLLPHSLFLLFSISSNFAAACLTHKVSSEFFFFLLLSIALPHLHTPPNSFLYNCLHYWTIASKSNLHANCNLDSSCPPLLSPLATACSLPTTTSPASPLLAVSSRPPNTAFSTTRHDASCSKSWDSGDSSPTST